MKLRSNLTSKEWDKREVSAILYYGQPPVREERLDIVCADGEVRRGVCEKIGLLLTKKRGRVEVRPQARFRKTPPRNNAEARIFRRGLRLHGKRNRTRGMLFNRMEGEINHETYGHSGRQSYERCRL